MDISFACTECPKTFVTRQGLEGHLLHAKKKCYDGPLPPGLDGYCFSNNRIYCSECHKLAAIRKPCRHFCADTQDRGRPRLATASGSAPAAESEPVLTTSDIDTTRPNIPALQPEASSVHPITEAADQMDTLISPVNPSDILRTVMKNPVATVNIPKNAVRAVADAYNRCLREVICAPTDPSRHGKLFLFTFYVLAKKKDRHVKQSTQVKTRARKFHGLSLEEISVVIMDEAEKHEGGGTPGPPSLRSIKRLISFGRYSDAVRLMSSDGVHPSTSAIVEILAEKHPQVEPFDAIPSSFQHVTFSPEEVDIAINSFPRGSSGGPFGLVELFLKTIITNAEIGSLILKTLAKFCELMVSGKFPGDMAPFYGSARLIPLIKKDGGVRPMAVGETLRRLACKLALSSIKTDIPTFFHPQQLGVGTANGAEAIVHSVAAALENLEVDESILQIDFANAFNLVSRERIFELVDRHFPTLANVINFLYRSQGFLQLNNSDATIKSCTGVQQGCPLAPFLFALVLKELTSKLSAAMPELKVNLWYLDDGHLAGKTTDLVKCLDIISSVGPELGVFLNLSKCVVYGTNTDVFPYEIRRSTDGLMVLGSPVGSRKFVADKVYEIVCKAAFSLFDSRRLEDPQQELLLLRCCSGSSRMTYWQRTCNPDDIKEQITEFDSAVDRTIHHILGNPVYGEDRLTMHLPLSMGGLGIPIAAISSDSSFVASVGASWALQPNINPRHGYAETKLRLISSGVAVPLLPGKNALDSIPLSLPHQTEFNQKKFMLAINGTLKEEVLCQADVGKKVVIAGRSCKGASFWLTSAPNIQNRTVIEPAAFRALLKYSIGMPLLSRAQCCPDWWRTGLVWSSRAIM